MIVLLINILNVQFTILYSLKGIKARVERQVSDLTHSLNATH